MFTGQCTRFERMKDQMIYLYQVTKGPVKWCLHLLAEELQVYLYPDPFHFDRKPSCIALQADICHLLTPNTCVESQGMSQKSALLNTQTCTATCVRATMKNKCPINNQKAMMFILVVRNGIYIVRQLVLLISFIVSNILSSN